MMQDAMKRYHQEVTKLAKDDPELKALLDGTIDETKVEDKELFELKKVWVQDYKQALSDMQQDDPSFTIVKPSLTEKLDIEGKWSKFRLFAETQIGDFVSIETEDTNSEDSEQESQNMGFRNR